MSIQPRSLFRRSGALCLALLALLPALVPATASAGRQLESQTVRYTGVMLRDMTVRETPDRDGKALATVRANEKISIYDYTPEWLYVSSKNGNGYVLRVQVRDIVAIDPQNTPPYGVVPHLQKAKVAADTALYAERDVESGMWCGLTAGSTISFWYIEDGWAVVPHHRVISYVPVSHLAELTPVSPTVDYAQDGDLIAAFTSFYETKQTELNIGRIVNIGVACELIEGVLQPGERFSFNEKAGPYRRTTGYLPSPVLVGGGTVTGYGGGTCQVSTTLYNALLQLPQGMTILHRRPHGPSGARYVPHGMDAAVGTADINLVFENNYPFPVRILAHAQDGALFVGLYKESPL
ncbi:MAG: VanW family protein [Clostridia bacterium]|nr:VanW family protein [Clostridia bacterium]